MNGKKSKTRNKSGFLTGLMIVSTGLIAGYHGFELALPEQRDSKNTPANSNSFTDQRAVRAAARQAGELDQLITASLDKTDLPNDRGENDRQGLAALIRSSADDFPVVNRALKGDREAMARAFNGPINDQNGTDALASFIEAHKTPQVEPVSSKAVADVEQQELAEGAELVARQDAVEAPVVKTALNAEIPYADSADIALFAADMPLPAKLMKVSRGARVSLLSRSAGAPYYQSPLVPRKFVSGKAFGGLAERAFQKRERRCMTTALYFEARSEPESGQVAVGQVVMNRVKSPDYPDTICGVVYQGSHRRTGCQFSFTCDGKADKPNSKKQWERSKRLANQVLEGKVWLKSIGDATHYHANYVKPRWRRKMARLKQIGRHIFYKSPNISVTDTYQRYMSGKRS